MKRQDRKLLHEILIVLAIKLILLYGIWSLWVADRHVAVTPHSTMDHLLAPH
ncbi:cytochrome oxidase putative small subunit CydP [Aquirhabdus parva]|uniref:cytochrome oxidase putative small subunit CydP n=1 Tax=Aquirhabdus parva TaxID=2283318 RepID=UPI0013B4218C|nr:cytochrome oxidase putative small subunit CydP [Aquirhabdus parva]